MSFADEVDEYDERVEEEYRELFPEKKRRHTFTEIRNKYRRNDGKFNQKGKGNSRVSC